MPDDDLHEAEQAERSGDAAEARQTAAAFYRGAQRLLLPAGVVWTDRESHDRRMEAFERIQQKLYGLEEGPRSTDSDLAVWQFSPGLVVRIGRTFRDYDGQEIRAGEVLHFLEGSYFFYEGGH